MCWYSHPELLVSFPYVCYLEQVSGRSQCLHPYSTDGYDRLEISLHTNTQKSEKQMTVIDRQDLKNRRRTHRWWTCVCGRCWSRAERASCRSPPGPSPWWWWCPASGPGTQTQSCVRPWPERPHQEMQPGTPTHLKVPKCEVHKWTLSNISCVFFFLLLIYLIRCFVLLTLFLLNHDGVTQGQEFEELQYLRILLRTDAGNEGLVIKLEFLVGVFIPAKIHRLKKKKKNQTESEITML